VALHVAWNSGVLLFGVLFSGYDPAAGSRRMAVPAAAVFIACALAFAWGGRRLREPRRPGRR
jgi:hypothetical protein